MFWPGSTPLAVLVGMLTLMAYGCANESDHTPVLPDGEPAQPTWDAGQLVGRVSQRPGGPASIIMLEPHVTSDIPVPDEPVVMDQYGRAFVPRLLLVREGQTVRFKNSEDELHNVNVVDDGGATLFNVGMPILGGTYEHTFDHAGDYKVACNVHQEMAALIVVTSSPFAVIADRNGNFAISDVPLGAYDLVLRRGAERMEQVVEVDAQRTELVLGFD